LIGGWWESADAKRGRRYIDLREADATGGDEVKKSWAEGQKPVVRGREIKLVLDDETKNRKGGKRNMVEVDRGGLHETEKKRDDAERGVNSNTAWGVKEEIQQKKKNREPQKSFI